MSFTFHPEFVRMRIPGQVPRLDPELDRTLEMPPTFTASDELRAGIPARPIVRAAAVAADLGLPQGIERSLTGLVKTLSSSSANEVDFRRSVMTHLIEQRYDSTLRRAVLQRAISFFRSQRVSASAVTPTQVIGPSKLPTSSADGRYHMKAKPPQGRPLDERGARRERDDVDEDAEREERAMDLERGQARGGKYHRRVTRQDAEGKTTHKYIYDEDAYRRLPDAHVDGKSTAQENLRGAVKRLLDKAGDAGCDVEHLRDLVGKHGAKTIAGVLTSLGAKHDNGRVRVTKSLVKHRTQDAGPKSMISAHMACFGIEYEEALWKSAAFASEPFGKGALSEQQPEGGSKPRGFGGPSPKKLPPGARRIWHNRIVERGVDDKWHVVGHVAGLEDPGKVPALDPSEIAPAHLKELIAKIKGLIEHEKQKHDTIHAPIPGPESEAASGAAKPDSVTRAKPGVAKPKGQEPKVETKS